MKSSNSFLYHALWVKPVFKVFVLGLVIVLPQVGWTQDPNLPPSGNFELIDWKVTLPDQTEILELDLANGFESPNEFYTDPVTGAMVFRCPNDGATGGSTYPRSELREMLRAGNYSIPTQGIGLNNWVFSTSTQANQDASGGVDGILTATVAVDHVSTTGNSNMIGRVIIGQIHGPNDEPCRLYYRKLPANTKGAIYFAHEPNNGNPEQYYEMIGSRSSSAPDPVDGIALGEQFSYEIRVVGNTLTVTIARAGYADLVEIVDMSQSGFEDDWMYFKAGCYNQNNSGDAGDYSQVSFFALDNTHPGASPLPVELVDFNGTVKEKSNHLSWTTLSEINNRGFEIHRSTDGQHFEKIGFVNGSTTSYTRKVYNFEDFDAPHTLTFYRLLQKDLNGGQHFSPIISLESRSAKAWEVFPNPVRSDGQIYVKNTPEERTSFQLFSLDGKLLRTYLPGQAKLSLEGISSGIYLLKNKEDSMLEKIIID